MKFKNEKVLEFYNTLNDYCLSAEQGASFNAKNIDNIINFAKNYEYMLIDFLEQTDINILKMETLLVILYGNKVGLGLDTLNKNVFEDIKAIKNNLLNKIFNQ